MSTSTPRPPDDPGGSGAPSQGPGGHGSPQAQAGYGPPQGPGGYGQPPQVPGDVWTIQGPGGTPPPPRGRAPKIIALAAALALIVAGGGVAFAKLDPLHLFKAGPQAAEALPGDALAYVGVDLDPSAKQKVDALRFLNHFPQFRDSLDLDESDDIRASIWKEALADSGCGDVAYADDIEPWLGYKFGLGVLPPSDGGSEPDVVFAAEIDDAGAAEQGLKKLNECVGDGDEIAYAFTGDYLIAAETDEIATAAADAAGQGSLADDDDFQADMESIGELGVATGWVDIEGLVELSGDEMLGSEDEAMIDLFTSTYRRGAATFRFAGDHVEIAASVFGDTPEVDHGENEIVNLPDSTVFAISQAGGESRLKASWDDILAAARASGTDVDAELADFENLTGLSIPGDLETLLGDNILFAADAEGLTSDFLESFDIDQLNAGVRFTNDPDELKALYDHVVSLVEDGTGQSLELSNEVFDDGLTIATNDDYAKTLADLDGNLGSSDTFESVTDDAGSKEQVLYVDFDAIEDRVLDGLESQGVPPETLDNFRVLRALGITSDIDGDYTHVSFRLSVND